MGLPDMSSPNSGALAPDPSQMTGITMKIVSVTAFVAMASCIKAAGQLPPGQIVFYRSLFAVPAILIWLAWRGQLAGSLATNRPYNHVFRGLIGVTAMGLGFFGLTRLPLPDVIALGYANPLLVVVFSAIFLGETIRIYRWSAVVAGLVGVFIVSWPKLTLLTSPQGLNHDEAIGVLAVLASAVCAAFAMLTVRSLVKTERTPTIVIWFSLTASVAGLATLPFGWSALSLNQAVLLVVAGVFGGLGQILLTQSYRYADMSTIAPFEYTSMLLSIVIGLAVFGEVPTLWTLGGGAIIIAAGIFIILREHYLGLERGRARKVHPPQ